MKKLLLLLSAAAAVYAGDSSRYREDFHYSYAQSAGGRLEVENFNGPVEITGWDQNTVDIAGTKYAESQQLLSSLKIEASSGGNAVHVKTVRAGDAHGGMGAKYVIHVPRRTELTSIHSSNGALRVEDIEGDARLRTSNGAVKVLRVRGKVDAQSSNGAIDAEDATGAFQASTSNGGIHVHLLNAGAEQPMKLTTSNGSVDLQLDAAQPKEVVASTSNGGITVRMPASAGADVDATTSSHESIHSDFEILTSGELSKHHIHGKIGAGGTKMELTTSNGGIRLVKI